MNNREPDVDDEDDFGDEFETFGDEEDCDDDWEEFEDFDEVGP